MKQFAGWFTHGVRDGAELRRAVQSASDAREVLNRLEELFSRTDGSDSQDARPAASHPAAGVQALATQ